MIGQVGQGPRAVVLRSPSRAARDSRSLSIALGLQTARRDHDDHDDQKEADYADSTVAEAVSITAKSAAEASEEKDHEKDEEDWTDGHRFAPSRMAQCALGESVRSARLRGT